MSFKEQQFTAPTTEERTKLDIETEKIYEQMYRLPPQKIPEPDESPNPPTIKNHW
jgi:hypothetical protein